MDQYDEVDIYGTFTPKEAERLGIQPLEEDLRDSSVVGILAGYENEQNYGSIDSVEHTQDGVKRR